jgi:hypothetical protein
MMVPDWYDQQRSAEDLGPMVAAGYSRRMPKPALAMESFNSPRIRKNRRPNVGPACDEVRNVIRT